MAGTSDEIVVDMKILKHLMKRNLRTLGRNSKDREVCVIRRVFHLVRTEGEHDYDPKVISIGPLHRNNEALKPMEVLKWIYLRQLILRSRERNKLENYIKAVDSVKDEAMKFYDSDELDGLGTGDFVEMMVLDGCFIIEYLVKAYCGENQRLLDEVNWNLPLLRKDLLLLENQIPFLILETLFGASYIPDLVGLGRDGDSVTLMELAVCFVTRNMSDSVSPTPDPTVHLLHVYHACLRPAPNYQGSPCTSAKMRRRIWRLAAAPFLLLLSCLLTCKIPRNFLGYRCRDFFHIGGRPPAEIPVPTEIPSATQLYDSGVNFKKKTSEADCLVDLVDAAFDKEEGILEIGMFPVYEDTISTFRNLIAFEQMYSAAGNHITSHAVLMSSLVRTAEDVAMLKHSGIIHSMLKKDVQVVELFYQLCRRSYFNFDSHHNRRLFEDVRDYCGAAHNEWRAGFKHTYFGSPWTVASLIAATFVLLLTASQTFYTIYAYHHPPP